MKLFEEMAVAGDEDVRDMLKELQERDDLRALMG